MMELYSEPYAPTGNIGDSGFRKLLGTPTTGVFETVVREALQNCCDAAKLESGPRVLIRVRTLDAGQKSALRHEALSSLPGGQTSFLDLTGCINSDEVNVLEICDFGTTGLDGPTRADRLPPDTTSTDFIDFLRNVGTTRNSDMGGGTYGFGKASLYGASACSTIIVDTRVSGENQGARRLMACHLGEAFGIEQDDGSTKRYTGRHWWGQRSGDDNVVDPLNDGDSAALAIRLGLPARLSDSDSGTSVMILAPQTDGDTLEEVAHRIRAAVLQNFWPRMTKDVPPRMRLNIEMAVGNTAFPIPLPEHCPPLNLYAEALSQIRSNLSGVEEIRSLRPARKLGCLAIVKGLKAARHPAFSGIDSLARASSSILGMRPAGMVVKAFEGAALPDEQHEWAGVFVVSEDPEVEQAYADAEPPAHDDWQPTILPKGPARTFVNVGIREVKKHASSVCAPGTDDGVKGIESDTESVTDAAIVLGGWLDGKPVSTTRRKGAGRKAGVGAPRLTRPAFDRLEMHSSGRVAVFKATYAGPKISNVHIEATPLLGMDAGTARSEVASEERRPTIAFFRIENGEESTGNSLEVKLTRGDSVEIGVAMPDDCAVSLALQIHVPGKVR